MLKFDVTMDEKRVERAVKRLRSAKLAVKDFESIVIASPKRGTFSIESMLNIAGKIKNDTGGLSVYVPDSEILDVIWWKLENELTESPLGKDDIRVINGTIPGNERNLTALLFPGVLPGDYYGAVGRPAETTICLKNRMGIGNNFKRLFSKPMRKTSKEKRHNDFIGINNRLKEQIYGSQLFVEAVIKQMESGFPDLALSEVQKNLCKEELKKYVKLLDEYCRLYEGMEAGDLPEDSYFDRRYMVFWLIKEYFSRNSGSKTKEELMKKAERFKKESAGRRARLKNRRYRVPVREANSENRFLQLFTTQEHKEEAARLLGVIRRDEEYPILLRKRIGRDRFTRTVMVIVTNEVADHKEEYPVMADADRIIDFANKLFEYPETLEVHK